MECERKIQKLSILEHDGMSLVEKLMEVLDEDEMALVSILAKQFGIDEIVWFIGEFEAPSKLCRSAYEILENFK